MCSANAIHLLYFSGKTIGMKENIAGQGEGCKASACLFGSKMSWQAQPHVKTSKDKLTQDAPPSKIIIIACQRIFSQKLSFPAAVIRMQQTGEWAQWKWVFIMLG